MYDIFVILFDPLLMKGKNLLVRHVQQQKMTNGRMDIYRRIYDLDCNLLLFEIEGNYACALSKGITNLLC